MESTIADLVRRATDGDEVAWSAIVDRFAPLLWSICRRHRLSGQDADDVAQAVWLRLLEHLPTLRDPAALPGWLATTTRRECLRVIRTERPAQELHEEAIPDQRAAAVDDGLLRAERFDALRLAFAALGERCRRLLAMLLLDPPPEYAQIGAELGMPIGSIGPTRGRCLDALRRTPELAALLAAGPNAGSTGMTNDDDDLMADLAAALAEARDVPAGFSSSGRELYTWLTVDAELAELAHDSLRPELLDAAAAAPVRAAGTDRNGPRSLTFRTPALSIDLDVEPSALRGQLVGAPGQPVPPEAVVEAPGVAPVTAPVDAVGYFEFVPFPFSGKRFRLHCGAVVTPWID